MTYIIAIPSYNRADVISKKTLQTLKRENIPKNKIYIFVANQKEYKKYVEAVDPSLYKEIIVGKKGITQQRKFISSYFPEKQYIISMDDDIEDFLCLKSGKLSHKKNIEQFFEDAYDELKKNKLYIWGIYPVQNAFFMKHTKTTDLRFLIGCMFGYINRHLKCLQPSIHAETKEDYEQTILYYLKDGGVLRFNDITVKTKFNALGGLGTERFERNKTSAEYLQKKYPDIVTIFHRENGMTEVKLKKLPNVVT
jgi:hypothetical protein